MDEKLKNDLLYVCSLIEFIGRVTKNHRSYIVEKIGVGAIEHQLTYAEVNHCLSFEQVAEEIITDYAIEEGEYDTISSCKYTVPTYLAIGKVYQRLIWSVKGSKNLAQVIYEIFTSFLSDRISDFNSSVFYSSPSYLKESYLYGELLDD